MATVYLSAKLPKKAAQLLTKANIDYAVYQGTGLISKQELLANLHDTQVLITALSTQVDEEVLNAAPKLKLIANFGAGFNNIDVQAAQAKGIAVTNTPFVSSTSTAELTCGLIIALLRRIAEGDRLMRTSGFAGWAPLFFLGHQLAGKTLGIVGLGGIGQEVAKRMHAFNMKIIYTQRHQARPEVEAQCAAEFVSFDDLLAQSDVVTLHLPLNKGTFHMIDEPQLAKMKDSAVLINCARGPIINEDAVLAALQNKQLAGAALDVYEHEPEVADEFKQLKNVVLTPHIGNATIEARDAMAQIVAENAIAVLNGQAPKYVVK
ncbi:MAG: NAD(P)-dependent oxidoreductase [Lactobacillus sp.]